MTVVNPLARRRSLAAALTTLRTEKRWSGKYLAQLAGVDPSTVSRLEKPERDPLRKPDLLPVHQILDKLGLDRDDPDDPRWRNLARMAEEASRPRWWDASAYQRMGEGQERFALVEMGAATLNEYAVLLPGTVQTEDYATHRVLDGGAGLDATAIVAGRMARQRQLAEQGTHHHLIIEPQAVQRMTAPPAVMAGQLQHLLHLIGQGTVEVRVLPVDVDMSNGHVPLGVFAHLSYPDGDPDVAIVDNVAEHPGLIVDADEVKGYAQLHERLRGAALSVEDSAAFIREAADGFGRR